MSILDCLRPATPPEPKGARLVTSEPEPITSEARRESNRRDYQRRKEKRKQSAREKGWWK
jgi:hypothetical protein